MSAESHTGVSDGYTGGQARMRKLRVKLRLAYRYHRGCFRHAGRSPSYETNCVKRFVTVKRPISLLFGVSGRSPAEKLV